MRDPNDMSDEVDSDCSQRHLMTECWLGLMEDVHDLDMDSYILRLSLYIVQFSFSVFDQIQIFS